MKYYIGDIGLYKGNERRTHILKNKKKNRLVVRLIILTALGASVIFTIYTSLNKDSYEALKIGDDAPDFSLVDLNGERHQNIRDKVCF